MGQARVNGVTLECRSNGSGESVFLVHGSASDYRTWRFQEEVLAADFNVICYSRRYHWPNAEIASGAVYSMTEHVDDLEALIRDLDAAPAHLVGHSYGAFLCLLLAIREPGLVRTLVLAEPPVITLFVSPRPRPSELLRLLVIRPRTAAVIIGFGAAGIGPATKAFQAGDAEAGLRRFARAVFGRGGYDSLPESRRAEVRDNLSNVEAEILGPGLAPLNALDLQKLQLPVLLVTGESSVKLFQRLTDALEELLPRASRVQIPAASHMMHEDNAPAFNRAVRSFLAANA
jgi:pimeloyl-ACP methyl ester carboxylesterase